MIPVAGVFQDAASAAQALAAPFVAATVFYAARQVRQLRNQVSEETLARRLESTRHYVEHVAADDVRSARHWLLNHRAYEPHKLTQEDRMRVLRLAVAYDRVGLLARFGLLDEDMAFSWQGREIVRLWELVMPVVAVERATEGREDYCRAFQDLATRFAARATEEDNKNASLPYRR